MAAIGFPEPDSPSGKTMTKIATALFIPLLALLSLFLGAADGLARGEVLYITVDKLPSGLTAEKDSTNVILQTVQAVRREMGDSGKTEFVPWARGLSMLSQHRPAAVFPVFRTRDREDVYRWAGPIARIQWGLFQLANAVEKIDGLEEAREKVSTIGVFRKDPRGNYLKTLGFSIEETNSVELNVSKLVHGRVRLIVFSRAGLELLKTNPQFSGVTLRAVVEFEPEDLYIAFSKETDPDYVLRWNAALKRLRQSGAMERIWDAAGPQELIPPK